MTKSS